MSRTVLAAAVALALSAAGLNVAGAKEHGQSQLAPDIVRDIQRSLNQKGYRAGSVDGVMGDSTRQAVAQFQHDNDLPGGGRIDQRTLAALGVTGVTARTEAPTLIPPGQTVTPEMTAQVQGELQRLGYDVGRTDGVWGDSTSRALTEFQRDRNLARTGRIDRDTLAALEAGGVTQTGQVPQQPAERR
ncbi:MAG TPA: peptidoglycan-binding domain-containing protein [Magnetospirillum sp.]|jgi:peptidoglycan hydrolase-like protein with peptidoglycan-binding domain|nr:peptidoglycan-binding domain-containing protein [Magnetospirillum sp.]